MLPVSSAPIRDGAVAIEDGRIAAVGTQDELGRGAHYGQSAIVPGLVNAHSHLEYAVFAGFGDGLGDFSEWIGLHVERKSRLDPAHFVDIARVGAAECLGSGVTTIGDCSYSGAAAQACADLGLGAIVYIEVFGSDPTAALTRFGTNRERFSGSFSENVRPGVSPHTPFTASADVFRACSELGLPTATHLSESRSETAYLLDGSGPWEHYRHLLVDPPGTTGTRLLAGLGLLGPDVVAAHCVEVDAEEIALLAERGAAVAHCPRSNALLGCGIAPVRALLDAGVTVGLGTDSPASTPSFDMFEELRAAVSLARAREHRPDALGAHEALGLATLGSAKALGLDAEIGSLELGKRADLTIVSLEGSPFLPWEDPAAAVVLGGSPDRVTATLVGGEVRYERGGFDWRELRQKGRRARARLLGLPDV